MPTYDFDFQRYVERRKGAREAERREGASYAYAGDSRIRKLLGRARPVELALEATVRLWRATARAELLGTARKATESCEPRVLTLSKRAAERLHVATPPVFVSPLLGVSVETFGTDDEPQVLLHAQLADALTDPELLFALGRECGRIQNNHVLLETARYYLHGASLSFMRWIVRPAVVSLDAWARRGVVTADRAGLLACRDLPAALSALDKIAAAGSDRASSPPTAAPAGGNAVPPGGDLDDGDDTPLDLARRKAALAVFARSAYFRAALGETGGLDGAACDAETARALKGTGAAA